MTKPLVPLATPPVLEAVMQGSALSMPWVVWFTQLYNYVRSGASTVADDDTVMVANGIYIVDSTVLVTLTLPPSFVVGDKVTVIGKGTGGWKIAQNAGQTVHSTTSTTTGTGGSISSTARYDNLVLQGMVRDTDLSAISKGGTLTFV